MYRVILCNDYREGHAYAVSQGFRHGNFRVASRAGTIKGLRVAEIHQLPSFEQRRDKHSILAALRYARVPAWHVIDDGWAWPPRPKEAPEHSDVTSYASDDTTLIQTWGDPTPTRTLASASGAPVATEQTPVEPMASGGEIVTPEKRAAARKRPAKKAEKRASRQMERVAAETKAADRPIDPSDPVLKAALPAGPIAEPALPDEGDFSGPVPLSAGDDF